MRSSRRGLASNELLSTALDKTNAVTVWVTHVHLAIAPALIGRFEINHDTFGLEFSMKFVYIFDPKKDHAPRHTVARKRRNMQLNVVSHEAHVAWIRLRFVNAIREQLGESQTFAIKLFGRSDGVHMQDWNRELKHYIASRKVDNGGVDAGERHHAPSISTKLVAKQAIEPRVKRFVRLCRRWNARSPNASANIR